MNLSNFESHVSSLKSPHVYRYFGPSEDLAPLRDRFLKQQFLVCQFDGGDISSFDRFHSSFKGKLLFYDWYGDNWDAYHELMIDLDWLDFAGVFIVITNAERTLMQDPESLNIFLNLQEQIGKSWANGEHINETIREQLVPFYTTLVCTDHRFARHLDDLLV